MLLRALHILISQKEVDIKICLLIDGLDEYAGEYKDLVKIFNEAALSSHVKICVSSRPEAVFTDTYSSTSISTLALQDLTKNDIRQYVNDNMINDPRLLNLAMTEPFRIEELVSEIVDSANRVFLWVRLTVDSLLRGLSKQDRIKDLLNRLRMLPPDLEKLFDLMVLSVKDVYKDRASRIYQLVETGYAGAPEDPLTVYELYFAQEDNSMTLLVAKTESSSWEEMISHCKDVEIWLQSWCGGLLEVHHNPRS